MQKPFTVHNRHAKDVRRFSVENKNDTEGVSRLREVLEDRLRDIKKAKTWKHERVLSSPQDAKV